MFFKVGHGEISGNNWVCKICVTIYKPKFNIDE